MSMEEESNVGFTFVPRSLSIFPYKHISFPDVNFFSLAILRSQKWGGACLWCL